MLEPLSSSQITGPESVHTCQEQRAYLKWFSLSLSFGLAWQLLSIFQRIGDVAGGHCPILHHSGGRFSVSGGWAVAYALQEGEVMTKEQTGMGAGGKRLFMAA